MDNRELRRIATYLGTCISVAVDPAAADAERWVVGVGLDAVGAGPTPGAALSSALWDLADSGVEGGSNARVQRSRSILQAPLRPGPRASGGRRAPSPGQPPLLPELALMAPSQPD